MVQLIIIAYEKQRAKHKLCRSSFSTPTNLAERTIVDITVGQNVHGFTLRESQDLPEINGKAHVFFHEKSGARLLFLENDDPNKAFSISFKTPPTDDTGVFHILEHSVLCGSDKFPVKEPFVNLLKNSMQTFLNAMTFPDKTMYPVASTNQQDLINLMDVYLDAVLHPAIYNKKETFEQEGWHLEIDEETNQAFINGVVFNEMKGALSDPDAVLYDKLCQKLFPDTAYGFESGGTPAAIPSLTYEQFLDTHARHYRLDNSYLMLYGNLDAELFLSFLDASYLSPCSTLRKEAGSPNPLEMQKPVVSFGNTCVMETSPDNHSMALGYVVGTASERLRLTAIDILLDAVAGSNEAPLKRRLLDADLANDVNLTLADSMLQPFVMVTAKGLKPDAQDRFKGEFESAVRELIGRGVDPELIEASLSHSEFVLRERNFGISDGVAFAMTSMSSWLYDEENPYGFIRFQDVFAQLRELMGTDYFTKLLEDIFFKCNHAADMRLIPVEQDTHDALALRLEKLQETLSEKDKEDVTKETQRLREAQERPDTDQELATLPHLGVADIEDAGADPSYERIDQDGLPTLRHRVETQGITYAYRYFGLKCLSWEQLPYATLLAMVLGKLDTSQRSASQLDTAIQSKLGNLSFFTEVNENADSCTDCTPCLAVSSSALSEKADVLASLTDEVMTQTIYTDLPKIKNIAQQRKVAMEMDFSGNGHRCALGRLTSYYLLAGVAREQLAGVDFYRFLTDLLDNWDQRCVDLPDQLQKVAQTIFNDSNCLLSFGGTDESLERFMVAHRQSTAFAEGSARKNLLSIPAPQDKKEAFIVPTDVTYAAFGYDRRHMGIQHNGTWLLAARALSYDYLWNEVRVKGGAYGVGFQAMRTGGARFYSYRDPHLDQTIERFRASAPWLSSFDPSPEEFEGYVVSTIAGLDAPEKPREVVRRQASWHLAGIDPSSKQTMRSQVIASNVADLQAIGQDIEALCERSLLCVFGNGDIIGSSKADLTPIQLVK